MISGAWSAFEAMAADLWIAALNKDPKKLALNYASKNGQKNFIISQLAEYQFNIKYRIEELYKNHKKVSFDTLNDIKIAYSQAYGIFENEVLGDTKELFIAEKTRHLIAHRSGIVDAEYAKFVRNTEPYGGFCIGNPIPLNGPLVAVLIESCASAGIKLLNFVDKWAASDGICS